MVTNSQKVSFKKEVADWAKKLRVEPKEIVVMRMTRKWASCSTRGRVCFSEEVLSLEDSLRQYIIAHELLHLKVPNHGRLYKSLLSAHMPDWKNAKDRLEAMASKAAPAKN